MCSGIFGQDIEYLKGPYELSQAESLRSRLERIQSVSTARTYSMTGSCSLNATNKYSVTIL
jgi:hypothetical protein